MTAFHAHNSNKDKKYHYSIQWNNISYKFLTIVLVNINIVAFVYYQITQLVIPFAEHNFSPLRRIFFVIVLFESLFKTLFGVLISSLYLQIFIFYFGISSVFESVI
jgi:hypothetical protein